MAPGCKMALSLAMMALIEPGDEVLYPDPSFPIYPSFTRGLGATPCLSRCGRKMNFSLNGGNCEEDHAKDAHADFQFTEQSHRHGVHGSESGAIAELARKHDLWVIADEIYARILFSGEYKSIWALPGMAERTVIIDGFSKSFAMTGWRLGYAVAQKQVIDAMDMLVLNTFTCTAEFTQVAAIEALHGHLPARCRRWWRNIVSAAICSSKLNKIPGFRCQTPDGAFYAWVNIEETGMPRKKSRRLLLEEAGVAGIAGAAFGAEGKNMCDFRW